MSVETKRGKGGRGECGLMGGGETGSGGVYKDAGEVVLESDVHSIQEAI